MKENKRKKILAVVLLLTTVNYLRLSGNENVRAVQVISLLVIGALAGLLINEFITLFRDKRE